MDFSFLHQTFLGAAVGDYLAFAAMLAATLLLRVPLANLLVKATGRIAIRLTHGKYLRLYRSLLARPAVNLLTVVGLFSAFNKIESATSRVFLFRFPQAKDQPTRELLLSDVVHQVCLLLAIVFIAQLVSRLTDFAYRAGLEKARLADQHARLQLLPLLKEIAKIVVWAIALLWVLGAVFMVNVPALIAGVGIGGVAIALAAKESVENLFASFTILLDKPLQIGDQIRLGSLEGRVEKIGFRSTRLRHEDGAMLIIPNKKLIDETLENLTQRELRGMRFSIPIKYTLPAGKLPGIVASIETALREVPHVEEPVKVKIEPMNENAFQLQISFRLPYPFVHGSSEDVREAAYVKAYEVVQQAVATQE